MTRKACVAWHVCDIYFLAILCDLTSTFSDMTFVFTQYHSLTFTSFLCEFELFAAHLTAPTAQNAITAGVWTVEPEPEPL